MKIKMTVIAVMIAVLVGEKTQTNAGQLPENMALIPAGSFRMGDAFNDWPWGGVNLEIPVHTVYVSEFYMDKYEVTKALWDEVYQWAINNGYNFDNTGSGKAIDHPVQTINWYDAVKWCNARSEKEGRVPAYYMGLAQTIVYRTGQVDVNNDWVKWKAGYRLPTEAEWEKAARGGVSEQRFPWGDFISHDQANYYSSASYSYDVSPTRGWHPTFNDGVLPYTNPVGYFTPNGYGLYDMAGNVWEWCWDWYSPFYYKDSPTSDPLGPQIQWAFRSDRTMRGGAWDFDGVYCRTAMRAFDPVAPGTRDRHTGFRTALPSTALDPIQVITTQPAQLTYGVVPDKLPGKDSLVVVTHGWIPKEDGQTSPPDPTWVDDMANAISNNVIVVKGLKNWQVETYKWTKKAWLNKVDALVKEFVLKNAEEEGGNLGDRIGNQGWSHVHLIAHSAGAAVIQAATLNIKSKNINTVVHTTFLDPYVGFRYGGREKYGLVANWADNYFAYDTETFDDIVGKTQGSLDHTYNVDVTFLDTLWEKIQVTSSTSSGDVSQTCYQKATTHSWPYQFYTNTILPNVQFGAEGFGFPLSKEGGNWNFATNQYKVGKNTLKVLGSDELSCVPNPSANSLNMELPQDFSKLPNASIIINSPGNVIINGIDFILKTASPAWLLATIPITNKVNLVSFEAQFTSATGSEGLLSVYWETNVIGSIDERVISKGLRQYTFPLPETAEKGTRTFGFRLDAFSAIQSSVTVTNVALGFVGIREPFLLSFTGVSNNGLPVLQLTGPAGFNYRVESSTNLVSWSTIAILVNTNGVVRFVDSTSTNATARFYRAVWP
ncbi:MAG: SUMF1/EgtB/PvdO family nonheme iron enzyme [bacterium]|nr:SUMF1/EgtB/PvdO family nonheme iron enzyme [bacterium]